MHVASPSIHLGKSQVEHLPKLQASNASCTLCDPPPQLFLTRSPLPLRFLPYVARVSVCAYLFLCFISTICFWHGGSRLLCKRTLCSASCMQGCPGPSDPTCIAGEAVQRGALAMPSLLLLSVASTADNLNSVSQMLRAHITFSVHVTGTYPNHVCDFLPFIREQFVWNQCFF